MPFDNVLMSLRERMGHKKLLLKQKEVAEVFTSGRDAIVSFPTSYSKNTNAFPQLRYWVYLTCRYGLNGTKHILHIKPGWSDRSVPTIANNCMDNNTHSFIAFGFMISCQANNINVSRWCIVGSSLHSKARLVPHCHTVTWAYPYYI